MNRLLVCIILLLSAWGVKGQIYTGGKGDGAAMSCIPPVVTTLGETEFSCVSDVIVLAVHATGTNLQYRWQKKGANFFEDLTDNTYCLGLGTDTLRIINPTSVRDSGYYRCLVQNSCDSDTSEIFHINLNRAPWVVLPLASANYAQGVCVNTGFVDLISSIASEKNDIKYTWKRVDKLTGQTTLLKDSVPNLHLNLAGPAKDLEGLYVVTAYNQCGMVSDSVFLPVYDLPKIEWINPIVNGVLSTCELEALTLEINVSGGGIYDYYLQKVVYSLATDSWDIISAMPLTSGNYVYNMITTAESGFYRWAVYNQCSTSPSFSDVIELKVEEMPSFIRPRDQVYQFPADTLVCEGSDLEMKCKASGSGTKYYWTKGGVRIPGVDTNVLALKDIKPEDAGNYCCVAYNNCVQKVTGRVIKVKVDLRPRFDKDPFMKKRACVGDSITYFGVRPGLPYDSLRWYLEYKPLHDNGHFENCTSENFDITYIANADLGRYQVMAYNRCGGNMSEVLNLMQLSIPVAFKKGVGGYDALLCPGMEQKLSVSVTGSTPIHYRWILNEHVHETDTNFVTVAGQDIVDRNKYTVYAYNACNTAMDTGWVYVEVFDHYKFTGDGEYCAGHDATGVLKLAGSADTLVYNLYRDYGVLVETRQGTGTPMEFAKMKGGSYYITATNPKTECEQEMDGRPYIIERPAPKAPNFYASSYFCMGNLGADLVLAEWEKDVCYQLMRNQGPGFQEMTNYRFTGGVRIYGIPELNSPPDGQPRVYKGLDYGRYRVVATGKNGCTTDITLADSIHMLEPPSKHKLFALNGDSVNCNIPLSTGEIHAEFAELSVDRFVEGAKYTLLKNGVPDPDRQPDRTSPIGWANIREGEYQVLVETREGCTGTTNKVRIYNVDAPKPFTLSASGSLCADQDTDTDTKELTLSGTEAGIKYEIFRKDPYKLWYSFIGDGNSKDKIFIPVQRATYYVKATDATGLCSTTFKDELTVLASDFQVAMNPADIYLDSKGLTTWLHVDITGSYVQPLEVVWTDESKLQQTGIITSPVTQYHKQYYWPFCPCADKHDSWGSAEVHESSHGPHCTQTNCPFLYHTYKPAEHGCVYQGTEYNTWEWGGKLRWYDLYYCRDQVQDSTQEDHYENDTKNPFRDRLTKPVNEDVVYTVTVSDGAGCTHTDSVSVRVIGGKLRADILLSEEHKHYEYPFCPCNGQHKYTHYCSSRCNDQNCIRLYHAHKHEGCTKRNTEYIEYRGSYIKYYDQYYCCTNAKAADTIVYRNDELFFCSEAKGGDYSYEKTWSFNAPGYAGASWDNFKGDTVIFKAKESGWLFLRVTSMGQEVRDSIWIEVFRRPFIAYIQDQEGENRIDSLYLCKGEETKLYAYTAGGDGEETTKQWYGDGFSGPNTGWWIFTPEQSGWFYLTASNDGVVIKDSVYILLRESPAKPIVENPGVRCVVSGKSETIKVQSPTQSGMNYVLEHSVDKGGTYVEKDRYNQSTGGAVNFKVVSPVRDAGLYRIKAESVAGDHHCATYSEQVEFITPPSHDDITSLKYCDGEQLKLQFNSTSADMSYSILSDNGVHFETIKTPVDYFTKPFGAGNYKIVYSHQGTIGACSDTVPITVRKVEPAQQVDIFVNDSLLAGNIGACELQNAKIAIVPSENNVGYYLESPSGERIDLFTGNGMKMETVVSGRPYGTYLVKAEKEGCATLVNWFTFNRNPKPLVQPDIYYCYPYGKDALGDGVGLKYSGLEADVSYILLKEGVRLDTITGPGTKSFDGRMKSGKYSVIAQNQESGCFSTTIFKVGGKEAPKDFLLFADCGRDKNLTLQRSQVGVEYYLFRGSEIVDTLSGTGDALAFGVYNITGVYTAVGTDTLTGCSVPMQGSVQIKEEGKCDLKQSNPTCSASSITDLIYPCSAPGWIYYLKDVTTADILKSEEIAGNGGDIRWSSVGPRLIKPYMAGRVPKPSIYILYGKDVCGDIPLDTISVGVTENPTGILATENLTSAAGHPVESCINELENLYLTKSKAGVDYVLLGFTAEGSRDSLSSYHEVTASGANRVLLGNFKGYREYRLDMDYKGCSHSVSIMMEYKKMPELGRLSGESICNNQGDLEVSLLERIENQNYYLCINTKPVPLDTILWRDPLTDKQFAPQRDSGRYWVVVDNIDPVSRARICRDTFPQSFAVGKAPTANPITRYPELDGDNIYLCKGDTGIISLGITEPTVEYALFRDGMEISPVRQFRTDNQEITFKVADAGVYSVVGYLGACEQEMQNRITVYVDTIPNLQLYNTYYYCRGSDTGAKIEVEGAPYKCAFELRDGGLASPVIERDTVRFYKDGVSDTISFNYLCPAGERYEYVLTYQTRGGCRRHHYFDVVEAIPPEPFNVISTGDAVCEGECTRFAVLGDQKNVEYSLMKVSPGGDYEYLDNYVVGWGDRDTLWFPYPVCEKGEFYVTATYYSRPQCTSKLPAYGQTEIVLAEIDSIRECEFENYDIHYCADASIGGTIKMLNAQSGMTYYLCKDGVNPDQVGGSYVKTCTVDGATLEWFDIPADEVCEGTNTNATYYKVLAKNNRTRCSKWMKGVIVLTADKTVEVDAMTYPYYEFCAGQGVLLKVRAKGCGLTYEWYRVGSLGSGPVGQDADLNATQSGSYYCKITNSCGTVNSAPKIVLKVKDLTTMRPMGLKILCEGSSNMVYSEFTNVNDGDYIWFRRDQPDKVLSTTAWLEFKNVTKADQGYYVCVGGSVGKGYCNVYADTVFVQVAGAVDSVELQLKHDTICSGTQKTLSVDLTGYQVQWYYNGVKIPGATRNALMRVFSTKNAGLYSVKVSSGCGDRDPIPVHQITVDSVIQHLWHSDDQYLCSAAPMPLSIRTSPMEGVKYIWQRLISGMPDTIIGHKADITVEVPEDISKVTYRVFYYNTCNDYTNSSYEDVNVTIANNIKHTTPWPEELTFCQGSGGLLADRTLMATLSGTVVSDYLWLFNPAGTSRTDTVARGATMNSYVIPDDHTQSGFYSCVITTSCGKIKYKYNCWVRINTPAEIITDLAANAGKMCEGSYYTPTITATGSDLQFRWVLYSKTGTVDTIFRGIGYEWQDANTLYLLTENKYAGDTLRCIVYNKCGRDVSTSVVLEIEGKRTVNVEPETWVCYDSTGVVHVKLVDSQGDPYTAGAWSYQLQREDENPRSRQVAAGESCDTLKGLTPGNYVIKSLVDGVCNYMGQDMAVFVIKQHPSSSAIMTLPGGRRDTTLCAGASLPLYVKIKGGMGPFEATLWYKKADMSAWAVYNGWINSNPFYMEKAEAEAGYTYPVPIFDAAQYAVVIRDMNGDNSGQSGCDVFMPSTEILNVRIVERSRVDWARPVGATHYGECNLPINLKTVLNPTPANGIFHITRQNPGGNDSPTIKRDWTSPYILQSDGPGVYRVNYSTGGVCNDSSLFPIVFTVDSAPRATLIPRDTVICISTTPPSVYAVLHGTEPFQYLRVESSRLGRDGVVIPFSAPGWESHNPLQKQPIPFFISRNDSIVRYVVREVKDFFGCTMNSGDQPSTSITITQLPQLKVEGSHPAYGRGYWDNLTAVYNLPQGDSVKFRVTLTYGKAPWKLKVFQDASFPIHGAPQTYIVHAQDTVITAKQEGYYVFDCEDMIGCAMAASGQVKRQVVFAPAGYISINGLYLGGALGHYINQSVTSMPVMQSNLWTSGVMPDYGLTPAIIGPNFSKFIDWVFVEARKEDPAVAGGWRVVARDTCMLLNDGTVMTRAGKKAIELKGTGTTGDFYHIAVFHRNHLPVMTTKVQLSANQGGPQRVNLSDASILWCQDGVLDRHVWNIMSYYGNPIYAMAPAYLQINKVAQLVSMSNPNATQFNLDNTVAYTLFDVNFDGMVDFQGYFSRLEDWDYTGGSQDAWLLYLNRDRFSEIDQIP